MRELVMDRPWSTVWRDGDTWIKQCKSIWRFEPRLTAVLAERWPDRMPEVVEYDEAQATFVTRDAGAMIENVPNGHELWLEAIARYAELQRGEITHVDDHLAHGVPDQRLAVLPGDYADMLTRDELPWRDDQHEQLRRFEPQFVELCAALDDVATIQHDDLHIHNVFEGPRILDWGDSCIAHPYFSLVVPFKFVTTGQEEIRDAYLEAYGGEREEFERALRVGRIAHLFKWIRIRDVMPLDKLVEFDNWFTGWIADAVAQT
jgi:hypothetical protein